MSARVTGGRAWRVLALAVCLVTGLLLATTRDVSEGTEIRAGDSPRLSDLVRNAQQHADGLAAQRDELAAAVEDAQDRAATADTDVAATLTEIDAIAADAGRTEVTGPGMTVTLTDAPRGPDGRYPADASPNDLVVHQQDVQSVLNALWAGGAEAIGMQDQRLVATSAPRCIGNTLLLHGRTYSPPYVVTAIGDPERLGQALDAERGVAIYKQYATRFGLGYTQEPSSQITVPAYTGG